VQVQVQVQVQVESACRGSSAHPDEFSARTRHPKLPPEPSLESDLQDDTPPF
jgi:hypothetical protein